MDRLSEAPHPLLSNTELAQRILADREGDSDINIWRQLTDAVRKAPVSVHGYFLQHGCSLRGIRGIYPKTGMTGDDRNYKAIMRRALEDILSDLEEYSPDVDENGDTSTGNDDCINVYPDEYGVPQVVTGAYRTLPCRERTTSTRRLVEGVVEGLAPEERED